MNPLTCSLKYLLLSISILQNCLSIMVLRSSGFKGYLPQSSAQAQKNKKIHSEKNSLYFQKWKPALFSPGSKKKKSLPRENFLYFRKRKPEKISYISGNGKPEKTEVYFLLFQETKLSYISGSNFPSSQSKNNPLLKSLFYFRKWNFLYTSSLYTFFTASL